MWRGLGALMMVLVGCPQTELVVRPDDCTEEIPYDGIDQDCDGFDLLDVDGDGFDHVAFGGDDCDDDDATIHPEVEEDPWYDGVDQDCDGVDDYDQDGDGYVPDTHPATGSAHVPPYDGSLPGGDCDDEDVAINPGVQTDPPYDGVDSDCDCANEFDVDGDGFMWGEETNASAYAAYLATYGCDLTPTGWGDCDDDDSSLGRWGLEVLGSGLDEDCTGASDVAAWGADGVFWESVQGVAAGRANGSMVVAAAAYSWSSGGGDVWPVVAYGVDERGAIQTTTELGDVDQSLSQGLDLATTSDAVYLAYVSADYSDPDFGLDQLRVATLDPQTLSQGPTLVGEATRDVSSTMVDLGVAPTGTVFAAGCGFGIVSYLTAIDGAVPTLGSTGASTAYSGGQCALELDPSDDTQALLHLQQATGDPKPLLLSNGTDAFVDQDPGDLLAGPFEDITFSDVDSHDGVTAYYDSGSGNSYVVDTDGSVYSLLLGVEVRDLSVVRLANGLAVAAVTEDRNSDGAFDLVLLYGAGGNWTQVVLTPDETGANVPNAVDLAVGDSLLLVVHTVDEWASSYLYWMQFAPTLAP